MEFAVAVIYLDEATITDITKYKREIDMLS